MDIILEHNIPVIGKREASTLLERVLIWPNNKIGQQLGQSRVVLSDHSMRHTSISIESERHLRSNISHVHSPAHRKHYLPGLGWQPIYGNEEAEYPAAYSEVVDLMSAWLAHTPA